MYAPILTYNLNLFYAKFYKSTPLSWDIKNTNNKKYRTVRIIPFPIFTFFTVRCIFPKQQKSCRDMSLLSLLKLMYLHDERKIRL